MKATLLALAGLAWANGAIAFDDDKPKESGDKPKTVEIRLSKVGNILSLGDGDGKGKGKSVIKLEDGAVPEEVRKRLKEAGIEIQTLGEGNQMKVTVNAKADGKPSEKAKTENYSEVKVHGVVRIVGADGKIVEHKLGDHKAELPDMEDLPAEAKKAIADAMSQMGGKSGEHKKVVVLNKVEKSGDGPAQRTGKIRVVKPGGDVEEFDISGQSPDKAMIFLEQATKDLPKEVKDSLKATFVIDTKELVKDAKHGVIFVPSGKGEAKPVEVKKTIVEKASSSDTNAKLDKILDRLERLEKEVNELKKRQS